MIQVYYETSLSENLKLTPEGYLICLNVPLARTGEMRYMFSDLPGLESNEHGIVYIERDERIFDEMFLNSINGKPVVYQHHKVNAENWSDVARGHAYNVRREGHSIVGDLQINDLELINIINNGTRDVSLFYDAEFDYISHARYMQVPFVCNHIAIVSKGRAGALYAVKDEDTIKEDKMPETKEDEVKVPMSLFGKLFKTTATVADAESTMDLTKAVATLSKQHDMIFSKLDEIMSMVKGVGDKKDVKDSAVPVKEEKEEKEDVKDAKKDVGDADTTVILGAINAFIPGITDAKQVPVMMRAALITALSDASIGKALSPLMKMDVADMESTDVVSMLKSAFAMKQSSNSGRASFTLPASTQAFSTPSPDEINKANAEYYKGAK